MPKKIGSSYETLVPVKGLGANKQSPPPNPKLMHASKSFDEHLMKFNKPSNQEKKPKTPLRRTLSEGAIVDPDSPKIEVRRKIFGKHPYSNRKFNLGNNV